MCMVLIAVTVRVVMVLIFITVRTVMFVWFSYLLQPGWLCLCGFHAVTGRIFKSAQCLYCNSLENYVCFVFLPVTAGAVMSVWYSTRGMGM